MRPPFVTAARLLAVLTAVAVLAGFGGKPTSPETAGEAPAAAPATTSVAAAGSGMAIAPSAAACQPLSTRERVMQTILSAVPGERMSSRTRAILRRHAASVVLFGQNVRSASQLRRLTKRMRAVAPTRLLVAVDEEGGRVSRLGEAGIVRRLPSSRRLARTRSAGQVRALGRRLGRQMKRVGVDWDLAPVLDVTRARASSVIGDRSYGGSAARVARYGGPFARGLASAGVRTTGKHFPGHGRTSTDSHRTLPTVRTARKKLIRRDVRPYVRTRGALDAVMGAHVRFTALDRRNPATLSRAASRLLRRHVGFDGVLVTDALEMGAISRRYPAPRAAELAIRRGADMALLGNWTDAGPTSRRLARAARAGRIRSARLDEAAGRVLAMKGYPAARVDCMLAR